VVDSLDAQLGGVRNEPWQDLSLEDNDAGAAVPFTEPEVNGRAERVRAP
jgi:hypothetical protein